MKYTKSVLSGVICMLAIVVSFAPKAGATAIDLVITEVDNNTIQLSGGDSGNWLVSGAADSWTLTRSTPLGGLGNGIAFASWYEPENNALINALQISYFGVSVNAPGAPASLTININSDQAVTTDDSPVADGTVVLFSLFPNSSQIPYSIRFIDQGDASRVPDNTATALCLALGLIPLLAFKRLCVVRQ